jgi:outer membrane receptor for ferrienterochelin and colicins
MPVYNSCLSLRRNLLGVALLAAAGAAFAQDPPPPAATTTADAKVYTPADFTRYSPNNALDMLVKVPGFVIKQEDSERGMGQATGNVLINGQRISGKSTDVLDQLGKIPAANVVRIEIADGAKLDIPGLSGQVANVVTKPGGISGSWNWKPDVRRYYTNPQYTRGAISVSGSKTGLDWTLGLDNGANHSGAGGNTWIYNPDGSLRETRDDEWTGEQDRPRLTGHATWRDGKGSVANVNASVQKIFYHYTEDGFRFGDPNVPDRERSVRQAEHDFNYEVGGDYEFALGGGKLKLIGLDRYSEGPNETTVETHFADASPAQGSRFEQDPEENERIARAEYRWKWGGDWQLSTEYAFNSLDNISRLFVLDPDNGYIEVPLPGGTATVQEDRYEAMATYGRALRSNLTFQISAGGEYSRLEQVGAGGLTRTFKRPKGSLTMAWKATPKLDVNFKLERRVGQLNFYDFLASVDLNNGQANSGNPDLVPPQTWEIELETRRDLGAYGNTSLRLYHQRIDDIVDTIPIGPFGESPGNIDRATVNGIEWKGTFNMDPFGWRGARFDAHVQFETSEVEDPLTFEKRPISNNLKDLAELSLRHDIPDTPWAWGTDLSYSFYARDYRLTQVGRQWEGPLWGDLYVERKDWHGITARLSLNNLFNAASMWDRTVYLNRRTGPIDFIEDRHRRIGPILNLTLSGKF